MKDAPHFDRVGGETIVERIRKTREQDAAHVTMDGWARFRRLSQEHKCGGQRGFEIKAEAGTLPLIPVEGVLGVPRGEGRKADVAGHGYG